MTCDWCEIFTAKVIIAENSVVLKIKVKFALEQAVKTQKRCKSIVLLFL
jgi:hypothetical protein